MECDCRSTEFTMSEEELLRLITMKQNKNEKKVDFETVTRNHNKEINVGKG